MSLNAHLMCWVCQCNVCISLRSVSDEINRIIIIIIIIITIVTLVKKLLYGVIVHLSAKSVANIADGRKPGSIKVRRMHKAQFM